jgi:ABC-2 type transport system permease protein
VLLIVAVVGYSLVIAAGALRWQRVEMVHEVFPILVYLAGGVFVPLDRMPGWLQEIARFVPITPGVAAIRGVLLDGRPLDRLWGTGGLVPLVISTVGWLLAGVVAFGLAGRSVRRKGSIT